MNISSAEKEKGDTQREKRGRLHPWARPACMAESPRCSSQRGSIRTSERVREMEQGGGEVGGEKRKAEGGSQAGD